MLLQKDSNPDRNTVTAYGADYLEINRTRYHTSICFGPQGQVRELEISDLAQIGADLLHELAAVQAAAADPLAFLDSTPAALSRSAASPEVILIGTGTAQRFLPPALTEPLLALGIGIECMNTQAAARTYNILMSEDRHVLAILLKGEAP